jgi:hypothetical protein
VAIYFWIVAVQLTTTVSGASLEHWDQSGTEE